jgi:DNA repair exonuclease SbcCD ATPase subunit
MGISVSDVQEFLEKLRSDPALREQLRQLLLLEFERQVLESIHRLTIQVEILTRRVDELAEAQKQTMLAVQELTEAQQRTDERVGRLETALAELAEAQRRTDERLGRLETALAELAEAQRRTDERVGRLETALAELAEAQRRTEQKVEELAEAQRRTDERVGRLETALAELAEAQRRTEQKVDELAEAQKRTASQLGRLEDRIGASTEQEAADTLGYVLRQKGYRILKGPFNLYLNGEIDVIYQLEDQEGKQLTAVLEAKVRLSHSVVEDWAQRMRADNFRQKIRQAGFGGPYLVYAYGMRADPSAYEAVKRFGIGLITDRGEQVEPQGTLP